MPESPVKPADSEQMLLVGVGGEKERPGEKEEKVWRNFSERGKLKKEPQ